MFFPQQVSGRSVSRAPAGHPPRSAATTAIAHRSLLHTALVILCVTSLTACRQAPAAQNRRGGGGPSVSIQTTTTKRITVQRQVDLAGTLLSPDQAKVSAEAAGVVRVGRWSRLAARCASATRS